MRRIAPFLTLATMFGPLACSDSPTSPADPAQPILLPSGVESQRGRPLHIPTSPAVAFVSDRDGVDHIYLANSDGSEVTRLTEGWSPAWSMDGRKIAFVRKASNTGPAGIYVMDLDGAPLRYIGPGSDPAWSPDGRIAFIRVPWRDPPGYGLYVMNADGTAVTLLLDHSWLCRSSADCAERHAILHPAWSPDGSTIAFQAYMDADRKGVGSVNADGSNPRLFQELLDAGEGSPWSRGANTRAAWSPDGSTLAVITGNPWFLSSYPYVIYTYDTTSGALKPAHNARGIGPGSAPDNPDWTADGRSIVFDASSREGDPRVHRRIFTVSVGTGEVRKLIAEAANPVAANYRDYGPVWSRAKH